MKKIFFIVAPAVFCIVFFDCANAQTFNIGKNGYQFSIPAARSYVAEVPYSKSRLYLNSINIRAVRDFMKRYNVIDSVSWYITNDGGFKAHYISGGIVYTTYYNKHGSWKSGFKAYSEAQLPIDIRHMVKREYYDHSIALVYEPESFKIGSNPTYIIRLEDERSLIFIRIRDVEMDVWKKFEKQE